MTATTDDTSTDPSANLDLKFIKGKVANYHRGMVIGIQGNDLVLLSEAVRQGDSYLLRFAAVPGAEVTEIRIDRKSNLGCGLASLAGTIVCGLLIYALMAVGFVVGIFVIGAIISIVGLYNSLFIPKWHVRFILKQGECVWETREDGRKHTAGIIRQLIDWGRTRRVTVVHLEEWLALNGK